MVVCYARCFHEAVNLLEKDKPLVVATVIRTKGSTPQKTGAKLLEREDGTGVGTLGGDVSRVTSGSRPAS